MTTKIILLDLLALAGLMAVAAGCWLSHPLALAVAGCSALAAALALYRHTRRP